jgi:excisionase family DNA binding protein
VSDLAPAVRERIQRLAYGPAEAAALLGISRARLYELMAAGDIPSMKLGARRLIRHDRLVAYLDQLEADQ